MSTVFVDKFVRSVSGYRYKGRHSWVTTGNHVSPIAYVACGGDLKIGSDTRVDIPNRVLYGFPTNAVNRSWADLVNAIRGEQAQIAQTLIEMDENIEFIYESAVSLKRAYSAAKHGKLGKLAKSLRPSDVASKWLGLNWGILPATADIWKAVNVLGQEVPIGSYKGHGPFQEVVEQNLSGNPKRLSNTHGFVVQGCDAYVNNPNLFLLQQLGLVNIAATAWDLIPFTVVIDWFVDVGSFLNGFSDLLGVEILNPYSGVLRRTYLKETWRTVPRLDTEGKMWSYVRDTRLKRPVLDFNVDGGLIGNARRAANAISLLVLALGR